MNENYTREAVWQYINTYIGTIDTFDIYGDTCVLWGLSGKKLKRTVNVKEAEKFYMRKLAKYGITHNQFVARGNKWRK